MAEGILKLIFDYRFYNLAVLLLNGQPSCFHESGDKCCMLSYLDWCLVLLVLAIVWLKVGLWIGVSFSAIIIEIRCCESKLWQWFFAFFLWLTIQFYNSASVVYISRIKYKSFKVSGLLETASKEPLNTDLILFIII